MQVCPNCGEENPDRFRLCGICGTKLAPEAPSQVVRKTVTIVFCDLKGSTSMGEKLDTEALRVVLAAYFSEMKTVLEHHGGTVEKFIGDARNTAARLEQADPALEILIGESTYRLVKDAIDVDPVEPLTLKGKAKTVHAYRLVSVNEGEGVARRLDAPMVGRTE